MIRIQRNNTDSTDPDPPHCLGPLLTGYNFTDNFVFADSRADEQRGVKDSTLTSTARSRKFAKHFLSASQGPRRVRFITNKYVKISRDTGSLSGSFDSFPGYIVYTQSINPAIEI